jgi:hypothetical protein
MPQTPTIRVQRNLEEEEIGVDAAINSNTTNWKKKYQS